MNTLTENHVITGLAPEEIAKEVRRYTAYSLREKQNLAYPDSTIVYTTTSFTGTKPTLLVIDDKEMSAETEKRRQGRNKWEVQVTVAKEGGFEYSTEQARISMEPTGEPFSPPLKFYIQVLDSIG